MIAAAVPAHGTLAAEQATTPAPDIPGAPAEAARRREAIQVLAHGWHTVGPGTRCPRCRGPVVVGATVRIAHASACPRARRSPRPAPAHPPAPVARQGARAVPQQPTSGSAAPQAYAPGSPARRHHLCRASRRRRYPARSRQRACYYEQFGGQEQIRPGRWFISGARVKARGRLGMARRLTGSGENLRVAVVLDGAQAAQLFALADLARAGGAP